MPPNDGKECSRDKIPVIDIYNLFNVPEAASTKDDEKLAQIGQLLCDSLNKYGFVYLSNHGIPQEIISKAFSESEKFFLLPQEVKETCAKDVSNAVNNYHGYVGPGKELVNETSVYEMRENFDVIHENRIYPTKDAPEFQPAVESLEDSCRSLGWKLLKLLGEALKLDDPSFFQNIAKNVVDKKVPSVTDLRTNYYPPIPKDQIITPGYSRCAAHCDWGLITLLFQDDMGGLEIKTTDGEWIEAEPILNTIVVNVGELLEYWTSGYLPATLHRVLVPEKEVQRRCARQSIVLFINADDDVVVEPVTSEILPPIPSVHRNRQPFTARDYFVKKATDMYSL